MESCLRIRARHEEDSLEMGSKYKALGMRARCRGAMRKIRGGSSYDSENWGIYRGLLHSFTFLAGGYGNIANIYLIFDPYPYSNFVPISSVSSTSLYISKLIIFIALIIFIMLDKSKYSVRLFSHIRLDRVRWKSIIRQSSSHRRYLHDNVWQRPYIPVVKEDGRGLTSLKEAENRIGRYDRPDMTLV